MVLLRPAEPVGIVSGKITWDGLPVNNGHIEFHPVGEGQVQAAIINDSRFQLELPTGPRRVVVVAKDIVGYTIDRDEEGEPLENMYVAIQGNVAPEAFADGSVHRFEVTGGEQTYDISMTGPPSLPLWIDGEAYIAPEELPVDAWVR
jgi:hypothetical protein